MTLIIFTSFLALALVPGGRASPTGVRARNEVGGCIEKCRINFGWPGHPFPNDPWGLVIDPKIVSGDSTSTSTPGAASAGPASVGPASVGPVSVGPASAGPIGAGAVEAAPSASLSVFTPSAISTPSSSLQSSSTQVPSPTSTSPSFKLSIHPISSSTPSPPPPPKTSAAPPPPPTHSASPSPSPSPAPAPAPAPVPPSGGSGGSGSTSGQTSESDIQAYLAGHNNARAQHGAAPLTYSQDLAAKAQQWANGCVFKHSGGTLGPFGENLAAGTGDSYGISEALKSWTDESSQYDPSNPQPSHFTQVVWKATTQVGCALQNCDGIFASSFGKAHYYVCEYSVQGNVIGDFAANVQA